MLNSPGIDIFSSTQATDVTKEEHKQRVLWTYRRLPSWTTAVCFCTVAGFKDTFSMNAAFSRVGRVQSAGIRVMSWCKKYQKTQARHQTRTAEEQHVVQYKARRYTT